MLQLLMLLIRVEALVPPILPLQARQGFVRQDQGSEPQRAPLVPPDHAQVNRPSTGSQMEFSPRSVPNPRVRLSLGKNCVHLTLGDFLEMVPSSKVRG